MKGEKKMAKNKSKLVMTKLIGMKRTTVWLTKEQQEIATNWGFRSQEFAQSVFDIAMGFIVNLNPKTKQATIIDDSSVELTTADKRFLADALATELVKHLPKKEGAEK